MLLVVAWGGDGAIVPANYLIPLLMKTTVVNSVGHTHTDIKAGRGGFIRKKGFSECGRS